LKTIESYRDLEDFAPLAIRLGNTEFGAHYTLRLKAVGVGINLFKGSWNNDGDRVAHAYINNNSETEKQIHAANNTNGHVITLPAGATKVLDPTKIQRYFDNKGIGRFIFEGVSASTAACSSNAENCYLSVMIYDNQQTEPLVERKVYLDLHDVKDFYLQATAGSADPDPTAPSQNQGSFNANYTGADIVPQTPYVRMNVYKGLDKPENLKKDFTMLVHGWRMRDYEIVSFVETSFKRMYWSGYKGEFGGLSWPTGWFDLPAHEYDFSDKLFKLIFNLDNYNNSEAAARRVGPKFATWLSGLNAIYENTHIIAHSMGNVVVSEALRAHAQQNTDTNLVTSYTAAEAAEVAGAYNQNLNYLQHAFLPLEYLPTLLFSGCIIDGGNPNALNQLEPESSWRCYNNDNDGDYDMPPDLYRSNYFVDNNGQMEIRHGPTTDNAMSVPEGNAYYASNSTAVGRILNYHNSEDAALNAWEMNQLTKPDNLVLGGGLWKYNNVIKNVAVCLDNRLSIDCDETLWLESIPQDGIVTSVFRLNFNNLQWGNTIAEDNNVANILAHIIPARTRAMGQGVINTVTDNQCPVRLSAAVICLFSHLIFQNLRLNSAARVS